MITEEQRLERRLGIGGSDMPIILGFSSYKTPYQLYCEKKGIIDTTFEKTPLQYWGEQLEPVIRREFRKRNHVLIKNPKTTFVHPFYDFIRGNLDGFIPKWNAVFEAKCSHAFMAQNWGESGSDTIPMEYLVQVAFYCSITNSDAAYIAVLIGGNDYREFKYTRDLELEHNIINAAANFWYAVQHDIAPPPTAMIDLKLMYPKTDPNKIKTINKEIMEQYSRFVGVKEKIKELTEQANKERFNILKFMEDTECLVDEWGNTIATAKINKRGTRTFLVKGDRDE
jgi:putative phage-type endonuclease